MKNILLVATREYKQIASTRGFWVMLLVLPLVIGVTQIAGRFFRPQLNSAYVLVDAVRPVRSRDRPPPEPQLPARRTRRLLRLCAALGAAVRSSPDAVWAKGERWFTDAQIEQFVADGGIEAAMAAREAAPAEGRAGLRHRPARLRPRRRCPPASPRPRPRRDRHSASPTNCRTRSTTPEGKRPLALVVYIPADAQRPPRPSACGPMARPTPRSSTMSATRSPASSARRPCEASGLTPEAAASITDITTPIDLSAPPQGAGREQVIIRSALPLAMVYLLLVTVMTTGSMMLQGVIEERSNKLLESILATIRPADLMYGKLLGLGAIGLTILGVWVGAAVGAALLRAGHGGRYREAIARCDRPAMDDRRHAVLLPRRLPHHLDAVPRHRRALELAAGCAVLPDARDHADHAAGRSS